MVWQVFPSGKSRIGAERLRKHAEAEHVVSDIVRGPSIIFNSFGITSSPSPLCLHCQSIRIQVAESNQGCFLYSWLYRQEIEQAIKSICIHEFPPHAFPNRKHYPTSTHSPSQKPGTNTLQKPPFSIPTDPSQVLTSPTFTYRIPIPTTATPTTTPAKPTPDSPPTTAISSASVSISPQHRTRGISSRESICCVETDAMAGL